MGRAVAPGLGQLPGDPASTAGSIRGEIKLGKRCFELLAAGLVRSQVRASLEPEGTPGPATIRGQPIECSYTLCLPSSP